MLVQKYVVFICLLGVFDSVTMALTIKPHASGECPNKNWIEWGQYCYLYVHASTSAEGAEQACVQEGAHLVSIHSDQENGLMDDLADDRIWIGLYKDPGSVAAWQWTDGTQFDYAFWSTGEPNYLSDEHCTEMYINHDLNGEWNNLVCLEYLRSYVCKYDKGSARNQSLVQPAYELQIQSNFTSASEDFTSVCTQAYATQMNTKTIGMMTTVNSLIGTDICMGLTPIAMNIILASSSLTAEGTTGSTYPTFIINTNKDLTQGIVHSCVSEINDFLVLYSNWGENVLDPESGCPEVLFAGNTFSQANNIYLCTGETGSFAAEKENELRAITEAFLNFGISHVGTFRTETGEDITPGCRNIYNTQFAQKALFQANQVNNLIEAGELCTSLDVQIRTISPLFVATLDNTGSTNQRYIFVAGQDVTFAETHTCALEVSSYLADHTNWGDSIIPPELTCPNLVFDPTWFTETNIEWICNKREPFSTLDVLVYEVAPAVQRGNSADHGTNE